MNARFGWTAGTLTFLYFCGAFLGANLTVLVDAVNTDAPLVGPALRMLLALMLPVLPLAHARQRGQQPRTA